MLNIKQRQMNLKYLGYYTLEIDGIEGNGTKQAYIEFQKDYELSVDGIYGPQTDSKLIAVIKAEQIALGVTVDGVAGNETTTARDRNINWSNIKHFIPKEFNCPCCGYNNMNLNVVKIADEIREYFNSPCYVNSGTRCEKHNKEVGGVSNSRHLQGKAIDIRLGGVSGYDLLNYCKKLVDKGKLRYTYLIGGNSVHIDIN